MLLREGFGRDTYMFEMNQRDANSKRLSVSIKYVWNSLPLQLRKCASIQTFKCKLKTFLFPQD